jgi:predicted Na+-dependent transporter
MQKQNLSRWGRHTIGLATVITLLPVAAWACAVCFNGDDALARGLNISILFLMSMPFAIFGSIFGTVYITYKRARRHASQKLTWTQKESVQ